MRRGECLAVLRRQQMAGHVDRVDGEIHHESRSSNDELLRIRPRGLGCPSTGANYGATVRTVIRTAPQVGNNLETTSRLAAGRRLPRPDARSAAARGNPSSVAIRTELQSGSTFHHSNRPARMDQLVTGKAKMLFWSALNDSDEQIPSRPTEWAPAPERHTAPGELATLKPQATVNKRVNVRVLHQAPCPGSTHSGDLGHCVVSN